MDLSLCRVCYYKQGEICIFATDHELQLSAKIMRCCSKVIMTEGDGLPAHICVDCEAQLAAAYSFVVFCEATDDVLRSRAVCTQIRLHSDQNQEELNKLESNELKPAVEVKVKDERDQDHQYEDDAALGEHNDDETKADNTPSKKVYLKRPKKTKYKSVVPGITKVCPACGHKSACVSAHRTHMRTHTGERPFSCRSCDKKYKDTGTLKRHIQRKHSGGNRERNFICENCGKRFYSKNDVKIHMRTHTGETPYKCTECPLSFTQISAMLRHKKRHTGERSHTCPTCGKGFCTREEMKLHSQGVHSDEKKYSCSICNLRYKYKNSLNKHLHVHSQPNRFECDHCGRTFHQKGSLKSHINKQHSEKSGNCDICCKNVSNLEMHTWRHTGQRHLKCEVCSSSFFDTKSLARHVNYRHRDADRFGCARAGCGRRFASRAMLNFHVAKLHDTTVLFPCDRCSRGFYRKNDLTRHKIGTHKEKLKP